MQKKMDTHFYKIETLAFNLLVSWPVLLYNSKGVGRSLNSVSSISTSSGLTYMFKKCISKK